MTMRSIQKRWWLVAALILILVGVGVLILLSRNNSPFPSAIRKQASFVILFPDNKSQYKVDSKSVVFNADPNYKSLTFNVLDSMANLTIVEQSTPGNFTDIPQLYDKTVEAMHPYAAVETKYGKVSLTHPPKKNNKQFAIINTNGTLLSASANNDLSDDQWRSFFNSLQILSP